MSNIVMRGHTNQPQVIHWWLCGHGIKFLLEHLPSVPLAWARLYSYKAKEVSLTDQLIHAHLIDKVNNIIVYSYILHQI